MVADALMDKSKLATLTIGGNEIGAKGRMGKGRNVGGWELSDGKAFLCRRGPL